MLSDVIATAYERLSVIVTINLPFENWTEVLGSERLPERRSLSLGRALHFQTAANTGRCPQLKML